MSTFLISASDRLIILKQYVTTGSAKKLIALILLRAFNSLLRIDLTLQKYYFRIFSLIEECCMTSPSVTPRPLWLSSSGRSLMTVAISRVMFLSLRSQEALKLLVILCKEFQLGLKKRDGLVCYHIFYSRILYY